MWRMTLLVFAVLLLSPAPTRAEGEPYAKGRSIRMIEGLKTTLIVPDGLEAEKKGSLLIALHSAGEKGSGLADRLAGWAEDGYVVCAPTATQVSWEVPDLKLVKRIAQHLLEVLPLDPGKIHVLGYSNGGLAMGLLAFDDDLRPCTATWVASGYIGAQVPKWAKKGLSAIALVGSDDPERRTARRTVPGLRGKVRRVEVREQEGLDHRFPTKLLPYLRWWMAIGEGRFTAGEDMSFAWTADLEKAKASQADLRRGGVMLWLYRDDATDDANHRALQHDVFFDPQVRFLGGQLPCVRLEAAGHEALLEAHKIEELPAILVFDKKGAVKAVHQGEITARRLAKSLKAVVPKKRQVAPR